MNPRTQKAIALRLPFDAVRLAMVLPFVSVIACGGQTPTAPDPASLRFTPRVAEPASIESATAEAGQGQITVRATLLGPDPCRTLEAEIDKRDREVALRVFIRPSGAPVCIQIVGNFSYDAVIEGLPRGRYNLQVVHTYPSTGWPTRAVLSQTVDVR